MFYDWQDYQSNSADESVALLLSERSQQLVLAALQSLDSRDAWLDVGDLIWDDIDAAIAEAYEEIMEVHQTIPDMLDALSATWYRTTNQAIAANTETAIIWENEVTAYGLQLHQPSAHKAFTIPATGAGYYTMLGTVWFAATAAAQIKQVFVYVNSDKVLTVAMNELAGQSVPFALGMELADGDVIEIAVLCPVAVTIAGSADGVTAFSLARGVRLT